MITFVDQESTEKTQKRARMVHVRQTSTGSDIPILLTTTPTITGEKDIRDDEVSEDTEEEDSTHDEYDQDSNISFDENIKEARKKLKMLTYTIPNWVETQKKLKWRQALRMATRKMDQ